MEMEVQEARRGFRLLQEVAAGDEVILLQDGKPVARLVPYQQKARIWVSGLDRGTTRIADDFAAPLPQEIQRFFEE